jgi:L-seryl-tRNA(Ser) seleniumtransferase
LLQASNGAFEGRKETNIKGQSNRARWSRRSLLGIAGMSAAGAFLPSAAATPADPAGVDYYDSLGVSKIINAAGTYTYLTASIMPPSVHGQWLWPLTIRCASTIFSAPRANT